MAVLERKYVLCEELDAYNINVVAIQESQHSSVESWIQKVTKYHIVAVTMLDTMQIVGTIWGCDRIKTDQWKNMLS